MAVSSVTLWYFSRTRHELLNNLSNRQQETYNNAVAEGILQSVMRHANLASHNIVRKKQVNVEIVIVTSFHF